MKKVLAVLVLIGLIWGGKRAVDGMSHKMSREEAQTRVRIVLTGLKQGAGATEYQTAVCMWRDGSYALGPEAFRTAADEFDEWARRRALTNLRAFEVGDASVEKAAQALESAVVVVKGSVDGKPFVAHAAHSKPLVWEQ
jgi:hypothetical protein